MPGILIVNIHVSLIMLNFKLFKQSWQNSSLATVMQPCDSQRNADAVECSLQVENTKKKSFLTLLNELDIKMVWPFHSCKHKTRLEDVQ